MHYNSLATKKNKFSGQQRFEIICIQILSSKNYIQWKQTVLKKTHTHKKINNSIIFIKVPLNNSSIRIENIQQ